MNNDDLNATRLDLPTYKNDSRPQRGLWAPGNYLNKCGTCGVQYIGDKRSMDCADCAYAEPPPESPQAEGEPATLLPCPWCGELPLIDTPPKRPAVVTI